MLGCNIILIIYIISVIIDNLVESGSNIDIRPETGEEDQEVAIMQVQQAGRSDVAEASTSTAVVDVVNMG